MPVVCSQSDARVRFSSMECWWSTANQMLGLRPILTSVVGGGGALRAAVLLTVGGGEIGLGGAAAEAHLGAPRRHLRHALLGLQGLGPDGRARLATSSTVSESNTGPVSPRGTGTVIQQYTPDSHHTFKMSSMMTISKYIDQAANLSEGKRS